jgi:multicomponent Na+:H+ antiporter subunit D
VFSSISHVGIMLMGMATFAARGSAGAILYLVGHAFIEGALFLCAGLVLNRFETLDERELEGRDCGLYRMAVLTPGDAQPGALSLRA